jgi:hypothetical protein
MTDLIEQQLEELEGFVKRAITLLHDGSEDDVVEAGLRADMARIQSIYRALFGDLAPAEAVETLRSIWSYGAVCLVLHRELRSI